MKASVATGETVSSEVSWYLMHHLISYNIRHVSLSHWEHLTMHDSYYISRQFTYIFCHYLYVCVFLPLPAIVDEEHHVFGSSMCCLTVCCTLTWYLYSSDRFHWHLPQLFITLVNIAENVFEVKDQGQREAKRSFVAEGNPSTYSRLSVDICLMWCSISLLSGRISLKLFIMWVGITEKLFKVRGQRSRLCPGHMCTKHLFRVTQYLFS